MARDIGDLVAGEYLRRVRRCDLVDYQVVARAGSLGGLHEVDVLALDLASRTAYLCQVATQLQGLHHGGKGLGATLERVLARQAFLVEYAGQYLAGFAPRFMLWSPVVPVGQLTRGLKNRAPELELVINEGYTAAVGELRALARADAAGTNDPFFRLLQILEALR